MRKCVIKMLVGLVIVLSFASYTFPEPGNGNAYGLVKQQLGDYFSRLAEEEYFSGSVLVAREGKILLQRGYGMANYEEGIPNASNTQFSIASMTKAFASMSIMMLEERGLLDVNDTIAEYIPEAPTGGQITIHQLLNMTSGLYLYLDNPLVWENSDRFHTPDELLDYYLYEPLRFEPGSQWEYCNPGYVTLGIIIERVSGMSFRDFIRANILDPLKMKHTSYDPYEVDFPGKAIGYDDITTFPPTRTMYFHPTIPYTAGAMYSTVRDMYKWDQALYTKKLVSRETLDRMFTPGLGDFGYGWYIDQLEVNGSGHRHIWYWGAYFGFHGYISRLVDDNVTIIILRNTGPSLGTQDELRPIVTDVAEILFN